ncbi:MAG: calcium-binding protein [Nitrosomonas sp. PRO4]|nr:calcium-binding protein [Nitrosomonas sp. PRO4]
MLSTKNLVAIAVGTVFILTLNTPIVFATDTAKTGEHQSGQGGSHSHSHSDGKSAGHNHHSGHQCEHMMSSVDQNKDGKISKQEFLKHHEAKFDKKDTNKDGFLDEAEISGMMCHMQKHDHQKDNDHAHGDKK